MGFNLFSDAEPVCDCSHCSEPCEQPPRPSVRQVAVNLAFDDSGPRPVDAIFGATRLESIRALVCEWCGADCRGKAFHDEVSAAEYRISGLCQDCQDKVFDNGD
jgi:hypothetical protein